MAKLENHTRLRVELLRSRLRGFGLALRKSPITDPLEPGYHTYEVVDSELWCDEYLEEVVEYEKALQTTDEEYEGEWWGVFGNSFQYSQIPWPGPKEGTYGASLYEIESWLAWYSRQSNPDLLDPEQDPAPPLPALERVVNLREDFDPEEWEDDDERSADEIPEHFRPRVLAAIKWIYTNANPFEWREFERWSFRRWERLVARQKLKIAAMMQADGVEPTQPPPDDPIPPAPSDARPI